MTTPRSSDARLRQFVWGECDPYLTFPKRPGPPTFKGWYSDHPVFEHIIKTRRPTRLVEVGSLMGGSAIHMAGLLAAADIDAELTCVDTFLGSRESFFEFRDRRAAMLSAGRYNFFADFLGNVERSGHAAMINPFPQTSAVAAEVFTELGAKFDFIYLDASHEYADVLDDLRRWYPLLDSGGVLLGDDFEEPWFGVIRAALEFSERIGRPLELSKAYATSPVGGRENTKFMLTRD